MSPFADTPHLWLTGHLERQKRHEEVVKIQAAVKGFLVRRRSTLHLQAKAPPPKGLHELMRHHGLTIWANVCPSAKEAAADLEQAKKRQECILHATMTLRLLGKTRYIQDLEWADYHERANAFHELCDVGSPVESIWKKFRNAIGI